MTSLRLKCDAKVPKAEQEITRKMQHHIFNLVYATYVDDAKRLTTKPDVCRDYLNDNKIDWDALPQKVKDVLVDLTYRGDYTGTKDKRGNTRKVIVPAVYRDQINNLRDDKSEFYVVLKNEKLWKIDFQVDGNRFTKRQEIFE
ncbi:MULTISPECIES: hypothetical protein [unclassified Marinomonas]|uniref:hypothetical protein n=1 Tax=unclassified Marinomonas TaxID=196814 RepID=UPI0007AF8C55|nr:MULTISPECIES: hypothetical protein [unclassified Marinomonas]